MDMKLRRVPIYRFNMVTMLTVTLVSLEFNSKLSQHNLATLSEFRVVSVVCFCTMVLKRMFFQGTYFRKPYIFIAISIKYNDISYNIMGIVQL